MNDGLSTIDRRALIAVAVQFFVNGMLFASFVPRLPEIRDRIDIGNDALGRLLAAGALAGVLGSLVVGRLIERFGTRNLLIVAGIALCSSLSIIGVATVPAVLVIGLAAMSIFDVLVDSAMNLQGSWISGRRRAPVMNRLHGLWSLGTVVGGVGASQVAGLGVSLRTHLFAVTIILLVVVLFVGTNLLRDDEYVIEQSIGEPVGPPISGTPGTPTSFPTRWLRGPLVLFAVVGACSVAMEVTSSDWAAFRLSDDFGAAAAVAGLGYVAFTSGMTVGRFGGDSMIVRFGQRRVADVGIAMTIAGLAVSSFVPNEFIVMLGYLAAGLGVATQFPRLYDEAARFPGRPGAGLGALTGGSRVALLFTPLAVGSLAESRLSVGAATAIVTLPAAVLFMLLI
ncbi:MAG: MFS transporter, partial [Ilumatobacter sp.]|uniref:MFS transporter n=1 Tax=Ilumatobacter sp. TaxID=1967498 RepID=UPI003C75EEAA